MTTINNDFLRISKDLSEFVTEMEQKTQKTLDPESLNILFTFLDSAKKIIAITKLQFKNNPSIPEPIIKKAETDLDVAYQEASIHLNGWMESLAPVNESNAEELTQIKKCAKLIFGNPYCPVQQKPQLLRIIQDITNLEDLKNQQVREQREANPMPLVPIANPGTLDGLPNEIETVSSFLTLEDKLVLSKVNRHFREREFEQCQEKRFIENCSQSFCISDQIFFHDSQNGKIVCNDGKIYHINPEKSTLTVCDLYTLKIIKIMEFPKAGIIHGIHEGKVITSIKEDSYSYLSSSSIVIWDISSGKIISTCKDAQVTPNCIKIRGERVLSFSRNKENIKVWDLKTGKCTDVISITPNPDAFYDIIGDHLVTCMKLSEQMSFRHIPLNNHDSSEINSANIKEDKSHFTVIGDLLITKSPFIEIYNIRTGKLISEIKIPTKTDFTKISLVNNKLVIRTYEYLPLSYISGKYIFQVWDIENNKCLNSLELTPDNRNFFIIKNHIVFDFSSHLEIRDLNSLELLAKCIFTHDWIEFISNERIITFNTMLPIDKLTAYNFSPSKQATLAKILKLLRNADDSAPLPENIKRLMKQLPSSFTDKIYLELFNIHVFSPEQQQYLYPNWDRDAFLDVEDANAELLFGRNRTSNGERAHAVERVILWEIISELVQTNTINALHHFCMLSEPVKNAIYGELYALVEFENDYFPVAEDAFLLRNGQTTTNDARIVAIRSYLDKTKVN